jgi:hypothetical protein
MQHAWHSRSNHSWQNTRQHTRDDGLLSSVFGCQSWFTIVGCLSQHTRQSAYPVGQGPFNAAQEQAAIFVADQKAWHYLPPCASDMARRPILRTMFSILNVVQDRLCVPATPTPVTLSNGARHCLVKTRPCAAPHT